MKKLFITAIFALAFFAFAGAQSMDNLINAFQNNSETVHPTISKEMMEAMAAKKDSSSSKNVEQFTKNLEKMDLFVLEKKENNKADEVIQAMEAYRDGGGFETLLSVNEKEDHVRIVAHKDSEGLFSEVNIMVNSNKEVVLVRFVGRFSPDDLQQIVNEQKNKF